MSRNGSGGYNLPAGNPVVTGTTISSTVMNNTLSDIATAIAQSISQDGQTPITANLPMTGFRHLNVADAQARNEYATAGQVQDGSLNLLTVSGSDAITATTSPAFTSYKSGMFFSFVVSATNTTTSVTLNINGVGSKNVTKDGATPLAVGDLVAGSAVNLIYDGTQFQLCNPHFVGTTNYADASVTPVKLDRTYAVPTDLTGKNRVINAVFAVNQRAFAGGSLTSGNYGHDRWKAGSGGVTYTVSGETATITAGTLQQVIEGANVPEGGTYTLSWTGTAQARVDSGSYAASPITVTGKTASANTTIEFGTGTVTKVQYEAGSTATTFERRLIGSETLLCQRYFLTRSFNGCAGVLNSSGGDFGINFPVVMRTTPTFSLVSVGSFVDGFSTGFPSSVSLGSADSTIAHMVFSTGGATTAGRGCLFSSGSGTFSAEL